MAYKKNRKMKVYEAGGYSCRVVPQIRLQGAWLNEFGFDIGKPICVQCEGGKLVITLRDEYIMENCYSVRNLHANEGML